SHFAEVKGRSIKGKNKLPRSGAVRTESECESWWMLNLVPAIGSGLLVAFSQTFWSYATIAEVYTLNTLLFLIILFLMLRWRRCILQDTSYRAGSNKFRRRRATTTDYDGLLYAAAIVFGLALGVHHVTIDLLLPALAA